MEDKQKILDLLLPALQATRNLHDIISLKYDEKSEIIIACFEGGEKLINVAMDSGTSMIRDIMKHII